MELPPVPLLTAVNHSHPSGEIKMNLGHGSSLTLNLGSGWLPACGGRARKEQRLEDLSHIRLVSLGKS